MEEVKPRGILKNAASVSAGRGLAWDETNLALNEVQKDSTMKITEPKTPYVRYDAETDTVMDLDKIPGFELGARDSDAPAQVLDDAPMREIAEMTITPRRGSEASEKMVKVEAGPMGEGEDDSDDELQDEDTREHRKAFAERRNSHYSNEGDAMKAAMKKALLEDEDDETEIPPLPNSNGN